MKTKSILIAIGVVLLAVVLIQHAVVRAASSDASAKNKLAVVWTSGDPEVANKVCFMYTSAAKKAKWFDEVVLIVWGPSAKLLSQDKDLQSAVKSMIAAGVTVQACVVCADMYGVADSLRQMGVEVKGMGQPLSDYLKTDWKVLTF